MSDKTANSVAPRNLARDIVLYAGCMPAAPFREYVAAAAGAGFDAITIWPLMFQRALSREGLDAAEMVKIVSDHELRISDIDACADWLPEPPADLDVPAMFRSVWSSQRFFGVAAELQIGCIVAAHLGDWPVQHEVMVSGFADFCDGAADHGLKVALEFMPFSGIPNLDAALGILSDADRPNAGLVLDLCHHFRSGGTVSDLTRIDPALVMSIQIGDGTVQAPSDLRDEAMYHRQDPGRGSFGLADSLETLATMGVQTCVGPELYRRGFSERSPDLVARDLIAATKNVVLEWR